MIYQYWGYLKTILDAPDPAVRDRLDAVLFTADDLTRWNTKDLESDKEWHAPKVSCKRQGNAVELTGHFQEVRAIDHIGVDDPSFWVPLSSLEVQDNRFPIVLAKHPVFEITYRCITENARPQCVWAYPGGIHCDTLPYTRRWQTLARLIPHFGFPTQLDALVVRLYSPTRTTESMEIESIRFRAMSPSEIAACDKDRLRLESEAVPKRYPLLDECIPFGVCLDAASARRIAELLGLAFAEYWQLALEDIARHHHNCILLEAADQLAPEEWRELLSLAERYEIKLVPSLQFPLTDDIQDQREAMTALIKPYTTSSAILAWNLAEEPAESQFRQLVQTKALLEEMDADHPLVFITRHPSAFPLFAPCFAAGGIAHFPSHDPWGLGEIARTHVPLSKGQHVWIVGPGFIYATGTPEWSTGPEMRLMLNLAFANGVRGWFTHSYHNDPLWVAGSCQRSLTGPFLAFSDLWHELSHAVERLSAFAPFFPHTRPGRLPRTWFIAEEARREHTQLPEGYPTTGSYHLQGPDFSLFMVVSNDVREMASVNVSIPPKALRGNEIYDLTDFIQERKWVLMDLDRHLEMFPGQARAVLVAEPRVCAYWRDVIIRRLIENGRRQMRLDLELAQTYQLDTSSVTTMIETLGSWDILKDLETMRRAQDMLVNLIYRSEAIREPRSQILRATAALCACDGALCRLIASGKDELAREWGFKVTPFAREIVNLRLALRAGRGKTILEQCQDLADRALALLADIRALS